MDEAFEVKKMQCVKFMRGSAELHTNIAAKIFLASSEEEIHQLMDEYERRGDELLEMLD